MTILIAGVFVNVAAAAASVCTEQIVIIAYNHTTSSTGTEASSSSLAANHDGNLGFVFKSACRTFLDSLGKY